MAEIITLTTPLTKPSKTTIRIQALHLTLLPSPAVAIEWVGNDGEPGTAYYPTPSVTASPSGAALITTLNKLNLSAGNPSLLNRILTRLQTDGFIGAGATSGTAD